MMMVVAPIFTSRSHRRNDEWGAKGKRREENGKWNFTKSNNERRTIDQLLTSSLF